MRALIGATVETGWHRCDHGARGGRVVSGRSGNGNAGPYADWRQQSPDRVLLALQRAWKQKQLVLFLGAGVSCPTASLAGETWCWTCCWKAAMKDSGTSSPMTALLSHRGSPIASISRQLFLPESSSPSSLRQHPPRGHRAIFQRSGRLFKETLSSQCRRSNRLTCLAEHCAVDSPQ